MESAENGSNRRKILYRGELSEPVLNTDALSPFFNYGQGFFETILYENGKLDLFDRHLKRMEKTCSDFGIHIDYREFEETKIHSLLKEENLSDKTGRIKIIYAPIKDAARWDTVVSASPYTRPVQDFTLSIHNEVQDTRLNRYKSLNYGFNLYWKEYYRKKEQSDEVLFLNREGNVLEGSYTNLLLKKDDILYCVGKEQNYLQGIMQDEILKQAAADGQEIIELNEGIPLDMLKDADEVILCNSLLREKKVKKIIPLTSPL